jgi:hypothetical protein
MIYWYIMLVIITICVGLIVDHPNNFSESELLVMGVCWPLTLCVALFVGVERLYHRIQPNRPCDERADTEI